MILDFLVSSALSTWVTEKLRPYFKKPRQNNVKKIKEFYLREMPEFRTVGELRSMLDDFSDEVELVYGKHEYMILQTREVEGRGYIHLGHGQRLTQFS